MDLADAIYDRVAAFPKSELFVLSQQMRSAALSVPSNIAEGQGRWSVREYRQFLRQARGSTLELENDILFAVRRRFMDPEDGELLVGQCEEIGRMINGLLRYLSNRTT